MKRICLAVITATAILIGSATNLWAQNMMASGRSAMQSFGNTSRPSMKLPGSETVNVDGDVVPATYASSNPVCTDGCPMMAAPNGCSDPAFADCTDGSCCNAFYVYGGFMYMRARNSDVAYAVAANGPITPGAVVVPRSDVAVVDQNYRPAFTLGVGAMLGECSSIGVGYTYFDSAATNTITTNPPFVVRSLVAHPSTFNTASDGLTASAAQDIKFQLADIDYRNVIAYDTDYKINYLVGARMGQLKQGFMSQFDFNGTQSVNTNVNFYGAGLRLGLEAERYTRRGFMCYGKSFFTAMPGQIHANYTQTDGFGAQQVNTGWNAGRIVTIMDLEVGTGWRSRNDNVRLSVGYMVSRWGNIVQTDQWIKSVQSNDYTNMNNNVTFDGFVARIEAVW